MDVAREGPVLEAVDPFDLDELVAASRALFVDEGSEPPGDRAHRVTLHRRLQRDARAWLFRSAPGTPVIAFALASHRDDRTGTRLEQFRVEPAVRRLGWGRRCVNALLGGPLAGATSVEVRVLEDNPGAVAFWRALGFGHGTRRLAIEPRPAGPGPLRPD